MDSGTYQPIIPNWMPSSYPSGRFSLITLRTALSAAQRSAGSAARYWSTVEVVMSRRYPFLVVRAHVFPHLGKEDGVKSKFFNRSIRAAALRNAEALTHCAAIALCRARKTYFWILPVAVLGSSKKSKK